MALPSHALVAPSLTPILRVSPNLSTGRRPIPSSTTQTGGEVSNAGFSALRSFSLLVYRVFGLRSVYHNTPSISRRQRGSSTKVLAFIRILRSKRASPSDWTGWFGSGVITKRRCCELGIGSHVLFWVNQRNRGVWTDGKGFLSVFTCHTPYPLAKHRRGGKIWPWWD